MEEHGDNGGGGVPLGVQLGAFAVAGSALRSSVGTVHPARHVHLGVRAALKVWSGAAARGPAALEALREAGRSAVFLDHPAIGMVFEVGVVDAAAAEASAGRWEAGSPWMATEWASGGNLLDRRPAQDWAGLRSLVGRLLDALAHAHSRGVLHGGLSPSDVVCGAEDDERAGWRLVDWGHRAALRQVGPRRTRVQGTLYYTAPEVLSPRLGETGPWTDLYALGCIVTELVTGSPPFTGWTAPELKQAHLYAEPSPIVPIFPVPAELDQWIRTLIAKDPARRFARAGDALAALERLRDPAVVDPGQLAPPPPSLVSSWHMDELGDVLDGADEETAGPVHGQPELTETMDLGVTAGVTEETQTVDGRPLELDWEWERAAVPDDPDPRYPPEHAPALVAASLPLLGHRSVRLVGRHASRSRLWQTLQTVDAERTPRVVVLRGLSGVGKRQLARWVGEHAHALGVASSLRAGHSPFCGPTHGLGRMVARELGCVGMAANEARERVSAVLSRWGVRDPVLVQSLVELFEPLTARDSHVPVRTGSPGERHALLARWLEHLCGVSEETVAAGRVRRTAVLWLEAVQWTADSLAFARYLLTAPRARALPVLVVVTVDPELLAPSSAEAGWLERLAWTDGATQIEVEPLSDKECVALASHGLGLAPAASERLAAMSAGRPLHVVQSVHGWIRSGELVAGRDGLDFSAPDVEGIADLPTLLAGRLDEVIGRPSHPERAAVELAAALGVEVDHAEWQAVCAQDGIEVPPTLVDTLRDAGLAAIQVGGWRFVHAAVHTAVATAAQRRGTWGERHATCAAWLTQGTEPERRARHLLGASDWEGALVPLIEGARRRGEVSEYRAAHDLLAMRREALGVLGVEASDRRWGVDLLLRVWLLAREGRLDETEDMAREAVDLCRQHGWHEQLGEALCQLAYTHRHTGRLREAEALYRQAEAACRASGDQVSAAHAQLGRARLARQWGELAASRTLIAQARAGFERADDERGRAWAQAEQGRLAVLTGHHEDGEQSLREALARFERLGDALGKAEVWRGLASAARARGDLDRAVGIMERAVVLLDGAGVGWADLHRGQLALLRLGRGELAEAARLLRETLPIVQRWAGRPLVARYAVGLLACLAAEGGWGEWDRYWRIALPAIEELGLVDPAIAAAAHQAGVLALAAGKDLRGGQALELARSQAQALGDQTLLAAVDAALASR